VIALARTDFLTDEAVDAEIERLKASPYVKLAKREEAIRYRRRQYMYSLRVYERKGRELEARGVTMADLDALADIPAGTE
jgi:hypothetical protein